MIRVRWCTRRQGKVCPQNRIIGSYVCSFQSAIEMSSVVPSGIFVLYTNLPGNTGT